MPMRLAPLALGIVLACSGEASDADSGDDALGGSAGAPLPGGAPSLGGAGRGGNAAGAPSKPASGGAGNTSASGGPGVPVSGSGAGGGGGMGAAPPSGSSGSGAGGTRSEGGAGAGRGGRPARGGAPSTGEAGRSGSGTSAGSGGVTAGGRTNAGGGGVTAGGGGRPMMGGGGAGNAGGGADAQGECSLYRQGGTGDEPDGRIPVCCAPSAAEQPFVDEVFLLLNAHRAANGLSALAYDEELEAAVHGHCVHMSEHDFFAHEAPEAGIVLPWDRAELCGTQANGENIAMGQRTPAEVMTGWTNSAGHNRNMLGSNFRRVGIGYEDRGRYWGQLFGN